MEPVMVEFMKELQLKNKESGLMRDGYEDRGFVYYELLDAGWGRESLRGLSILKRGSTPIRGLLIFPWA